MDLILCFKSTADVRAIVPQHPPMKTSFPCSRISIDFGRFSAFTGETGAALINCEGNRIDEGANSIPGAGRFSLLEEFRIVIFLCPSDGTDITDPCVPMFRAVEVRLLPSE